MPLIRATSLLQAAPGAGVQQLLAQLDAAEPEQRRAAALALGWRAPEGEQAQREAAVALTTHLHREADEAVREALFSALVELGGAETTGLLGVLLRHPDAALRNGAREALKMLGPIAAHVVDELLCDADPVVRLLAAEVLRVWPKAMASPLLARQLAAEAHGNVCGVLFDVAIALNDSGLLPALAACAARFSDEPFLAFAYQLAQERLGAMAGGGHE